MVLALNGIIEIQIPLIDSPHDVLKFIMLKKILMDPYDRIHDFSSITLISLIK